MSLIPLICKLIIPSNILLRLSHQRFKNMKYRHNKLQYVVETVGTGSDLIILTIGYVYNLIALTILYSDEKYHLHFIIIIKDHQRYKPMSVIKTEFCWISLKDVLSLNIYGTNYCEYLELSIIYIL